MTSGNILASWQEYDITVLRTFVPVDGQDGFGNDYTEDDNCVALWRFESDAFYIDTKGNNDLMSYGDSFPLLYRPPVLDSVTYKEGSSSAYFEPHLTYPPAPSQLSLQGMRISNADLDAGFPLKNGDTTKIFSICFWARPYTFGQLLGGNQFAEEWYQKGRSIKSQLRIGAYSNDAGPVYSNWQMALSLASADGSGFNTVYCHDSLLSTERWYFIAVTYEVGAYRIRVWDDTAQAILGVDKTGVAIDVFVPPIEYSSDFSTLYIGDSFVSIDGHMDNVVVFKDILTVEEIDKIRTGDYP